MRRTEILAAAAAAAHRFRRMLGPAAVKGSNEKSGRGNTTLDESTALLFALNLMRLSEESACKVDKVFRTSLKPPRAKRKETETDLFWLGHHLLDREISATHEPVQRDAFMNFLMKHLCRFVTFERSAPEAWEIGQELIARASVTKDDYSRFQKIYPEEHTPVVRTLLWEFTKGVAVNYRGDYRDRTTLDVFGIILTYGEDVCGLLANAD